MARRRSRSRDGLRAAPHPVQLVVPAQGMFSTAEVAELADALASGASGRKAIGVRVPASEPRVKRASFTGPFYSWMFTRSSTPTHRQCTHQASEKAHCHTSTGDD